jgi:hypothetical protein
LYIDNSSDYCQMTTQAFFLEFDLFTINFV